MMNTLLHWSMLFAMLSTAIGLVFGTIRLFNGPSAQDRVIALDTMYYCIMMMMIVLGMRFGHDLYFEIAMLIALVGFVGSIAMAKFLLRGEVIE